MGARAVGGARVAQLRKARGITQAALARRAGIPVNQLSKIEIGDRILTPAHAAAIADTWGLSLGALYGEAEIAIEQSGLVEDLRLAVRRYDIPDPAPEPDPIQLRGELDHALGLQEHADLAGLLGVLPELLRRATAHAHAVRDEQGWALLALVYSLIYWLAARYRWMDLVEIAPARQAWAAEQYSNPLVAALGVQDRAGAFLHYGDFQGGLTVIDRAIVAADTALTGPEKAFATGLLHLRGMTLAGLIGDPARAHQHIDAAWAAAEGSSPVPRVHYQLFTSATITAHVLTTQADLGHPHEVISLAEELTSNDTGLPPAWMGPVHITTARAHLELGDRASAQAALAQTWTIARQLAQTDPMALEVLRVLYSLHNRSRPELLKLAKQAGLPA